MFRIFKRTLITVLSIVTVIGAFIGVYFIMKNSNDVETVYVINKKSLNYSPSFEINYDQHYVKKIPYELYRVTTRDIDDEAMIGLLPCENYYSLDGINGYFANQKAFKHITKLEFTYKSEGSVGFYYGEDKNLSFAKNIEASETVKTIVIDFTDEENKEKSVSYFKIAALFSKVELYSVNINCYKTTNDNFNTLEIEAEDKINLDSYRNYSPTEGLSVTVPIKIGRNNGAYEVVESKTYTYYSFNYLKNNYQSKGIELESLALTDPRDVSTYFTIFDKMPVNFAKKNDDATYPSNYAAAGNKDDVLSLFGENSRIVSCYTLTGGYVEYIPWNIYSDGKPLYFEFDIKLDSYSFAQRGVGRLVGFEKGFSTYSNENNVCLFTDDHYKTFAEYLNNFSFTYRFDSFIDGFRSVNRSYKAQNISNI